MSELDDLKALLARLVTRQESLETAIRKLGGAPGPGSPYSIAPHRKATIVGTVPVVTYTSTGAYNAAVNSPTAVSPTWTKIVSDYEVTHDGALIQLPGDAIYSVDISAAMSWPLTATPRTGAIILASAVDTTVCGALIIMSAAFGVRVEDFTNISAATAQARGTSLIQGNNVAVKTANGFLARPGVEVAPTKITVTCTIHEVIAGSH